MDLRQNRKKAERNEMLKIFQFCQGVLLSLFPLHNLTYNLYKSRLKSNSSVIKKIIVLYCVVVVCLTFKADVNEVNLDMIYYLIRQI